MQIACFDDNFNRSTKFEIDKKMISTISIKFGQLLVDFHLVWQLLDFVTEPRYLLK